MTLCISYFQGGIVFWSSLIISIILIGFLSLYLPFKKVKSKWKFAFVPLLIILIIISIWLNVGFFGMKNSCEGLGGHFIKDYGKEISTIEGAKELFLGYMNKTEEELDSSFYVDESEKYFFINYPGMIDYKLYKDGKLYSEQDY